MLALILAAGFFWYSLRGIDWHQVRTIVGQARPALFVAAMFLTSTALFLRALRWRLLLNAAGEVTVGTAVQATAAGYFGNNFLPARGGELIRTFMISARSTLAPAHVLATAISERIADALILVMVVAICLPMVPDRPAWLVRASAIFALGAGAGIVLLAVLPAARRRWPGTPPWKIIDQAIEGIRAFHDAGRVARFGAFSLVIWTLDACSVVLTGRALRLDVPLRAGFLLNASLGLGSALPSTPGYVGIFQAVAVTILPLFGLSRTDAMAFILVAQALGYVVIGVSGAAAIVQYRRARRTRSTETAAQPSSSVTAASETPRPRANPGGS